MTGNELTLLLAELDLPDGEYIVFGGGSLALRGIREAGDLDLFVSQSLYERLESSGAWIERSYGSKSVHLARSVGDASVQAFCKWDADGWQPDFQRYLQSPEKVAGVPCMPLKDLCVWKIDIARPKDLSDLVKINEYLAEGGL